MSEQYWGCLDKMSEVNFSPAETLVTMLISKILYQTLCVFSQIKDRKHIEHNFHTVAGVMPHGWDLEVLGGQKL